MNCTQPGESLVKRGHKQLTAKMAKPKRLTLRTGKKHVEQIRFVILPDNSSYSGIQVYNKFSPLTCFWVKCKLRIHYLKTLFSLSLWLMAGVKNRRTVASIKTITRLNLKFDTIINGSTHSISKKNSMTSLVWKKIKHLSWIRRDLRYLFMPSRKNWIYISLYFKMASTKIRHVPLQTTQTCRTIAPQGGHLTKNMLFQHPPNKQCNWLDNYQHNPAPNKPKTRTWPTLRFFETLVVSGPRDVLYLLTILQFSEALAFITHTEFYRSFQLRSSPEAVFQGCSMKTLNLATKTYDLGQLTQISQNQGFMHNIMFAWIVIMMPW